MCVLARVAEKVIVWCACDSFLVHGISIVQYVAENTVRHVMFLPDGLNISTVMELN